MAERKLMEKLWIDSEDGRQAVMDLSQLPEALQVINEAGRKHTLQLTDRILSINIADAAKDRSFVVAKAELDGAKGMLKYLITLLNEAGKPRR